MNESIKKEILDACDAWDAGRPISSLEMGGLGPGYEQAIQILAIELLRAAMTNERLDHDIAEEVVGRLDESCGGFTGAQVGAAKNLADNVFRRGWKSVLAPHEDRVILVSKHWPKYP